MAKKKKTKKKKAKKPKQPNGSIAPKITPYPQAGAKVVAFEQNIDKLLTPKEQTQAEPEKRGRGRPRKDAEPAPPQPDVQAETEVQLQAMQSALKMPFIMWANVNKLDFLRLTNREAAELAEPVTALITYYGANIPASILLWFNFLATTGAILEPRIVAIKKAKKEKLVVGEAPEQAARMSPVQVANFPKADEIKPQNVS